MIFKQAPVLGLGPLILAAHPLAVRAVRNGGVAAIMPRLLGQIQSMRVSNHENPSALLRAGMVRVGNLVWSNQAERSAIEPR